MPEMQTCLFILSGNTILLILYSDTLGGWAEQIIVQIKDDSKKIALMN
jgi:hypothetical protein